MSRLVVIVAGPNAAGKTTVVRAVGAQAPGVRTVNADNAEGHLWKVAPAVVQQNFECLVRTTPVILMEGTDRPVRALARALQVETVERVVVFVLTMAPDVMRSRLQGRAAAAGKAYRVDFWTPRLLAYEGQRRTVALARRWFTDVRVREARMDFSEQPALIAELTALLRSAVD